MSLNDALERIVRNNLDLTPSEHAQIAVVDDEVMQFVSESDVVHEFIKRQVKEVRRQSKNQSDVQGWLFSIKKTRDDGKEYDVTTDSEHMMGEDVQQVVDHYADEIDQRHARITQLTKFFAAAPFNYQLNLPFG